MPFGVLYAITPNSSLIPKEAMETEEVVVRIVHLSPNKVRHKIYDRVIIPSVKIKLNGNITTTTNGTSEEEEENYKIAVASFDQMYQISCFIINDLE